ncbi:MSCRAMM family protein [Marinobacterium marinum]|uniref:SpaA-like prealbumin fold domain-containing protein n=1 Tax=Marinobacterium marinum TaxID=2756129 RepID=A0A7W1WWP6_9GAMM|nr:hypothetical protein [Marinobacterium marinum]MBA4501548.1 hypothetical protein [Marinobacterium marinum]
MLSRNAYAINWRKLLWLPLALITLMMSWGAQAVTPVQIGFTLEGCRLETGATYDQANLICIAPSAQKSGYTTGNLGKQWAELDYVPHRVTLANGNGDQVFNFVVAGDYQPNNGTQTGWDDITPLKLNTDLSDGSCKEVDSGAGWALTDGVGGADVSIYRLIEADMQAGETCVYDYAQRLSLGASEFSGSSLQSNLWNEFFDNSNIGEKRIQLPVADILPQEMSKDMMAWQDTIYSWNLMKEPGSIHLPFGDTCERDDPLTESTVMTITWTKDSGTPGMVDIYTTIYLTNPAKLPVKVTVTDTVYGTYGGSEGILDEQMVVETVPAANDEGSGTAVIELPKLTVAAGVTNLHDIAVATYEVVVGEDVIEVPGNKEATATADIQPSGNVTNNTAVITDLIGPMADDGAGYQYTVAFEGAPIGSFLNGYAGEMTTGEVAWNSGEQSTSGSVQLRQTIYLDEPVDSYGELPDVATLMASDAGEPLVADAKVTFSDDPTVSLTIHKTIDLMLDEGESATFTFDVYRLTDGPDVLVEEGVQISFGPGQQENHAVVAGLDPDSTYRVVEVSGSDGFSMDQDQYAEIYLPSCEGAVTFDNQAEPASAMAIKVTVPDTESPAGFSFLLTGPGLGAGVEAVSDGDGNAQFLVDGEPVALFEGEYTIEEINIPEGWVLTGVSGDGADEEAGSCLFTVDLPDSAGYTYMCQFENTRLAKIIIVKEIQGSSFLDLSGAFLFSGGDNVDGYDFNAALAGGSWEFSDANPGDQQSETFDGLMPGTYTVEESGMPDLFGLTHVSCLDEDQGVLEFENMATINLNAGEEVTCTYVNTKRAAPGRLIVHKRTYGGLGTFDYTGDRVFSLMTMTEGEYVASQTFVGLEAGVYNIAETIPADWDLTELSCEDPHEVDGNTTQVDLGSGAISVSIDDGELVQCYYTNVSKAWIKLVKHTVPAGAEGDFTFEGDLSGSIGHGGSLPGMPEYLAVQAFTQEDGVIVMEAQYTSEETVPEGWDLTNITCEESKVMDSEGVDHMAVFNVQPGEYVTCTFENTKRGMAEVLKTVSGMAPNGMYPAFDFQILHGGSAVAQGTTDPITGFAAFSCLDGADPSVCLNVDGMAKLVPDEYEFCELDVQPGWMLTGSSQDGPLVWYPWHQGEDYMGECAAFTLSAGETEQFDVDNTPPPGGKAHTIGFWKNWTSCDGKGNQYDRWMTDPEFYNILDEFLPIFLHPEMEVTQCAVGVDILDKRDYQDPFAVGDGRKKANDAAYALASQLMAVQLNLAAAAGTCPELMDAKMAAEQLLADINFTGTGDYLNKPKGPNKALAQTAKELAGILDSYNNNMLCPYTNGD